MKLSSGALNSLRKKVQPAPLPKQVEVRVRDLDNFYADVPQYNLLKQIPGIDPFLEPQELLLPDLLEMLEKSGPESIAQAIIALGDRPKRDLVFVHDLQKTNRTTAEMEMDSLKYVGEGIENPNVQCAKCENRMVSTRPVQNRSADEPPTFICVCLNPKCKNQWRMKAA